MLAGWPPLEYWPVGQSSRQMTWLLPAIQCSVLSPQGPSGTVFFFILHFKWENQSATNLPQQWWCTCRWWRGGGWWGKSFSRLGACAMWWSRMKRRICPANILNDSLTWRMNIFFLTKQNWILLMNSPEEWGLLCWQSVALSRQPFGRSSSTQRSSQLPPWWSDWGQFQQDSKFVAANSQGRSWWSFLR